MCHSFSSLCSTTRRRRHNPAATSKTANAFYGMVSNDWDGVTSLSNVTIAPPYSWEP